MTSIFDPALALTLLTHPFQVALMGVTLGALVRSAKPIATRLAYSVFSLLDFLLEKSPVSVAAASTVAIVAVAFLFLVT